MKLPDEVRKTLRQAKGKPVEIPWPENGVEPKIGHRYTVQSSHKAGEDEIVVISRREEEGGWFATARIDHDPVLSLRIKTKRAVESPAMGGPQFRAETEPEPVDSRYQRLLDAEGRLKTSMLGNEKRLQDEVFERETRLNEKRKRTKRTTLARAALERRKRHLDYP